MPAPGITDLFGSGASLSGTTLSIDLTAFTAEGFDATDPTAARIAAALIKKWKAFTSTKDTDPTCGLVVGDPFVTLATRGESVQRAFQYACTIYIPDSGAAEPDPDLVV